MSQADRLLSIGIEHLAGKHLACLVYQCLVQDIREYILYVYGTGP